MNGFIITDLKSIAQIINPNATLLIREYINNVSHHSSLSTLEMVPASSFLALVFILHHCYTSISPSSIHMKIITISTASHGTRAGPTYQYANDRLRMHLIWLINKPVWLLFLDCISGSAILSLSSVESYHGF